MTEAPIDVTVEPKESPSDSPPPSVRRLVDRLDPRLVTVLTVIGFGAPLATYLWVVHRYSLDVIIGDQWDDLTVIGHSYQHLFDWSSLWAPHNENRIFFPNLIVLLLAHVAHYNVRLEEYLSALFLVAAVVFLIVAHRRRAPTNPWLYYCPVALLAFSLVQYENTLWGFQMAWYLVLLSLAVAIFLLDRPALTWVAFVGASVAGVVGSYSSLQGLLIWPAGLVLLYHRRRSSRTVVAWLALAAVATAVYFYNFTTTTTPQRYLGWHHPFAAVKFYVYALGDVVGVPIVAKGPSTANPAVLALGVVILVLALVVLVGYGLRRDPTGGSPIGVALICVGLLFAAIVTVGRLVFGYFAASQSRYTTFDLLVPIGIYLALLERPTVLGDLVPSGGEPEHGRLGWRARRFAAAYSLPIARWVIAAVLVLQIGLGLHYGITGVQRTYASKVAAARVLKNIDHESGRSIFNHLNFVYPSSFIRKEARIAQLHHLSVFSGGSAREGLPTGPAP